MEEKQWAGITELFCLINESNIYDLKLASYLAAHFFFWGTNWQLWLKQPHVKYSNVWPVSWWKKNGFQLNCGGRTGNMPRKNPLNIDVDPNKRGGSRNFYLRGLLCFWLRWALYWVLIVLTKFRFNWPQIRKGTCDSPAAHGRLWFTFPCQSTEI